MKNVQSMMALLGQNDSVITFDLAIYVKAKEIQWRLRQEFESMVIRMGGFHIAMNYLAVLGKKYQSSGIEDLLIESGMYGSSTTSILLKGKSYNRGVRAHKIVMEAMFRLQWRAFVKWLSEQGDSRVDETLVIEQVSACLQTLDEGQDFPTAMHTMCDAMPSTHCSQSSRHSKLRREESLSCLRSGVTMCAWCSYFCTSSKQRGPEIGFSICLLLLQSSSSFVSFTQCSPTCGRMPLPSLLQ